MTGPIRSILSSTPARHGSTTARRCSSAGSRIAAATRTCVPRDRRTASTAGSSTRSRRFEPTRSTIRRSCGGSRTRGSRSSRSSASTSIAYTAFSRGGPGVALALTEDFRSFERYGLVMQPDDKDAALLPRRIDGSFALLHRPMTDSGAHIWISFSPDLRNWGGHKLVLQARRGAWWDANKVGLSPPLIETARGWLMLYHGVRQTAAGCLYRLGARAVRSGPAGAVPLARRLPGSSVPRLPTSARATSATSRSPAATRSAPMATRSTSITARRTRAWRSRQGASASCCAGSTNTGQDSDPGGARKRDRSRVARGHPGCHWQ